MADVFISYSHKDSATAKEIVDILESCGVAYFEYEGGIGWGKPITKEVHENIKAVKAIIPILSKASLDSQWVMFEIGLAVGGDKIVLPYLTDPDLDIPTFIRDLRCTSSMEDVRKHFSEYESAIDQKTRTEEIQREHDTKEAIFKSQLEALDSLTNSYWEIKKAFEIIWFDPSAKSYSEQMNLILDHRLKLQRLNNNIRANLHGLDQQGIDTISANLQEMDHLLHRALEEWEQNSLEISQLQKADERITDPVKKRVPRKIRNLTVLKQIKQDRFATIHSTFMSAAQQLREQINISMKELSS